MNYVLTTLVSALVGAGGAAAFGYPQHSLLVALLVILLGAALFLLTIHAGAKGEKGVL